MDLFPVRDGHALGIGPRQVTATGNAVDEHAFAAAHAPAHNTMIFFRSRFWNDGARQNVCLDASVSMRSMVIDLIFPHTSHEICPKRAASLEPRLRELRKAGRNFMETCNLYKDATVAAIRLS